MSLLWPIREATAITVCMAAAATSMLRNWSSTRERSSRIRCWSVRSKAHRSPRRRTARYSPLTATWQLSMRARMPKPMSVSIRVRGQAFALRRFRFYPAQNHVGRVGGAKIQGSNISAVGGFEDLYTIPSVASAAWHEAAVDNTTGYRWVSVRGRNGPHHDRRIGVLSDRRSVDTVCRTGDKRGVRRRPPIHGRRAPIRPPPTANPVPFTRALLVVMWVWPSTLPPLNGLSLRWPSIRHRAITMPNTGMRPD